MSRRSPFFARSHPVMTQSSESRYSRRSMASRSGSAETKRIAEAGDYDHPDRYIGAIAGHLVMCLSLTLFSGDGLVALAGVEGLSGDGRFEHSYYAGLQLCVVALSASGFRPRGTGHHARDIESLRFTLGPTGLR